MTSLTVLQERAAQLFVSGMTKSDAYRQAGYSYENMTEKSLHELASRLFADIKVSSRVEELRELQLKRMQVTIDRVVAEYGKLAFTDATKAFYPDGTLKPLNEMDEDVRACIAGMEVVETYIEEDGCTSKTKKVKLADKKGALDSLAKYLAMFVNVNKSEVTGKDGAPLIPESSLSREELILLAQERGLPTNIFDK